MPKSPDEYDSLQEQPESSERKPTREIFKEIAKTQLDCLGYSDCVRQLIEFFKGQGTIADLGKKLPQVFGDDNDYLNHIIGTMRRVPNPDEARKLLSTAIFGEPAQRNADGTVIVTSFTLAEPSSTITQSKFLMFGNKREDKRFVPNDKGTDQLLRKFISVTGFQDERETAETIFFLKKGRRTTLPHPRNKSLILNIDGPINSKEPDSPTAYSYKIQTNVPS